MTRLVNNAKTAMLLGGLFALFVWAGSFYGSGGMVIATVLALVTNFVAFFFSDKIAIAAMQGRELTSANGGDLYAMVEELSGRAGLPMPRVYLCPHDAPNAFATGRSPRKAAVAVTQGALQLLTPDEMRGVIGHELAHIKNRDTLTSTVAATISGVLATLAQFAFYFGAGSNREGGNPFMGLIALLIGMFGAALIKAMISRSREYVADHDGALIAGSPHGLIGALRKLEAVGRRVPLVQPNPAQNNLFIVEPLAGGGLTNLFATHPPTERRVAELMKLA